MSDDDPTQIIRRSGSGSSGGSAQPDDPERTRRLVPQDEDQESVILGGSDPETEETRKTPQLGEQTVIVGRNRDGGGAVMQHDFVRGWLAVVHGPGFGRSVEIGTGQNQIGRDRSNRIALPYGDSTLSRIGHAVLTYDPKSRQFFLTNSQSGANLTYLNGDVVLAPCKLKAGDVIELGGTRLRFIPLCGADFDWSDVEDENAARPAGGKPETGGGSPPGPAPSPGMGAAAREPKGAGPEDEDDAPTRLHGV